MRHFRTKIFPIHLIIVLVLAHSFLILFVQCFSISKKPARPSVPVQGVVKQFPDNSIYYIIYTIPDFFPTDIPLYPGGQIQKGFVYHERDMDLIFRTTDSIEEIEHFFKTESQEGGWKIDRSIVDPNADQQIITFPLTYNSHHVETFQYFAYRGHIFAAKRGNRIMVCRIVQINDTPLTIILQQIRTES